jgi:hypothetical protein
MVLWNQHMPIKYVEEADADHEHQFDSVVCEEACSGSAESARGADSRGKGGDADDCKGHDNPV